MESEWNDIERDKGKRRMKRERRRKIRKLNFGFECAQKDD